MDSEYGDPARQGIRFAGASEESISLSIPHRPNSLCLAVPGRLRTLGFVFRLVRMRRVLMLRCRCPVRMRPRRIRRVRMGSVLCRLCELRIVRRCRIRLGVRGALIQRTRRTIVPIHVCRGVVAGALPVRRGSVGPRRPVRIRCCSRRHRKFLCEGTALAVPINRPLLTERQTLRG